MTSTSIDWRDTPCWANDLPPMDLRVERNDDGSLWLRHGMPLEDFSPEFLAHIRVQSERHPDKFAYAMRGSGGSDTRLPWPGA